MRKFQGPSSMGSTGFFKIVTGHTLGVPSEKRKRKGAGELGVSGRR